MPQSAIFHHSLWSADSSFPLKNSHSWGFIINVLPHFQRNSICSICKTRRFGHRCSWSPRVVSSLPLAHRLPGKVLDSLSTETEDNLPDWTTGKNRGSKMMKICGYGKGYPADICRPQEESFWRILCNPVSAHVPLLGIEHQVIPSLHILNMLRMPTPVTFITPSPSLGIWAMSFFTNSKTHFGSSVGKLILPPCWVKSWMPVESRC